MIQSYPNPVANTARLHVFVSPFRASRPYSIQSEDMGLKDISAPRCPTKKHDFWEQLIPSEPASDDLFAYENNHLVDTPT
jgi:hypothetical protein